MSFVAVISEVQTMTPSTLDKTKTMADKNRLSLNQITTERWSLQEAVDGCMRFGIPSIALWRNKIADVGLNESVRLVRDTGVHVSSICRGGMFVSPDSEARKQRIELWGPPGAAGG